MTVMVKTPFRKGKSKKGGRNAPAAPEVGFCFQDTTEKAKTQDGKQKIAKRPFLPLCEKEHDFCKNRAENDMEK